MYHIINYLPQITQTYINLCVHVYIHSLNEVISPGLIKLPPWAIVYIITKPLMPSMGNPPFKLLVKDAKWLPNYVGYRCCPWLLPIMYWCSYCWRHHILRKQDMEDTGWIWLERFLPEDCLSQYWNMLSKLPREGSNQWFSPVQVN